MIKIIDDANVLNPNSRNICVHDGDAAHNTSKRQAIDYIYETGPEQSTSRSSTAQMDVPHAHGDTWWCCCSKADF